MEVQRGKMVTTQEDLRAKVLLFAIISRTFIIALSCISNMMIPDHDAAVYLFPRPAFNRTIADELVKGILGGLTCWDAQYFLHISHYGYTYENTLAFFPLFPFFTRIFAQFLDITLGGIINPSSTVLIAATILNLFFFVNSSVKLFELSYKILQDTKLAYMSSLFYCINPASIFFSAHYSESCFAFFTFSGMLFCVEKNKDLLSCFSLGLSGCIRSNGIINFGFIAHKHLKTIFVRIQLFKSKNILATVYFTFMQLFKLFIYALVFFAPFLLFQGYAYSRFCTGNASVPDFLKEYGKSRGLVTPDTTPQIWCNYTIPFSYFYVQNHYWDVGFLKYYQLKQIPNFILASPVIFLILSNSYILLKENQSVMISLGFSKVDSVTFLRKELKPEFFVFAVHAVFLTLFSTLFVHVQVTTRMVASSCPVLYWFVALRYKADAISSRLKHSTSHKYSMIETQENINSIWKTVILSEKPSGPWPYFLRVYFCAYLILGTILFSNFLPWT